MSARPTSPPNGGSCSPRVSRCATEAVSAC